MSISEKNESIINKIKQNKPQYNLERKTAQISALSSENVSKYEVLTGKDFSLKTTSKKNLLQSKDLNILPQVKN